ncbi:MAG: 3-oxoacyl-ACP synthase [Bacteroidetes bacterium]|nr:3-oxoacyl-ACP synthase [Bacteroidota bacterium]
MLKEEIINHCRIIIEGRIAESKKAMQNAQDAANNEEKSSAGDKYETGRAMGHLERDRNAMQVVKAEEELNNLNRIDPSIVHKTISIGALITSSQGLLFLAIGIGSIMVNETKVVVLSPQSPLAEILKGKKAGDTYILNGVKHKISKVE